MKILITGMTGAHCNAVKRRVIENFCDQEAMKKALEDLGHTVEWRRVEFDDDPRLFDLVIITMAPVLSFNGRVGALTSAFMAYRAHMWNVPTIIHFTDWQMGSAISSSKQMVKHPEYLYKKTGENDPFFFRDLPEEVTKRADRIVEGFNLLSSTYTKFLALFNMFEFGDFDLACEVNGLVDREHADFIDLTPEQIDLRYRPTKRHGINKMERHNLSSLMGHLPWVDKQYFNWPVDYFGHRGTIKIYGGERLGTEFDVIDTYDKYWSILAPAYPQVGWYRSRFVYAAMVNSVLRCGKADAERLGQPYIDGMGVETMTVKQRIECVRAQAECLAPWLWTHDRFLYGLDGIIKRAQALVGVTK